VVQNTYNKIIICGPATEKNYSKIEETCERKNIHKVHNSISLQGRCSLSKYETDKLYNYCCLAIWRNAKNLEVVKRAVWTSFFTSSQQIKLQYGLYTNDDDN